MRLRRRKPRFAGAGGSAEREFNRQRRQNIRDAWHVWVLVLLGIGGVPERMGALRSGSVEATTLSPEFGQVVVSEGYRVLVDLGKENVPFQSSGIVVSRSLIKSNPQLAHIRLVAHTGYGSPEDRRRAHEAGFDAHLVKPAELSDLEAALRG